MSGRATLYFIARRVLALGVLLVFISFAVFSLLYVAPGSVEQILIGTSQPDPELIAVMREKYHLDEPFLTQYWLWASDAIRLDFGDSIATTLPVTDEIRARLQVSAYLGLYAYILTALLGVSLGIWAALRRGGMVDRVVVGSSIVGISAPAFVLGLGLLYLFAIVLPWFPSFGQGDGFIDQVWHLTLPAVALAIGSAAFLVKHTRAAMVNVLDQDYLTFARARGLGRRRILFIYALRNALIPVVTVSALILASVITGAVLIEVTFSLPGIGTLLVTSVTSKDLPMVQGVTMIIAIVIMLANLAADLIYFAVDPRIRLGRGT